MLAQSTSSQVAGTNISLKQCVDIAIQNNLLVQQSDITKQSNNVYFNQAKDNLLPYIGASGSQGESFGRSLNTYTYQYVNQQISTGSYGISGSLILFSGLKLQNAIKQNAYAYDASKLDLQQQKENITLSVVFAYLQVLTTQDLLDISRKQADVDEKQVERLDLQNKSGALLLLSNLSDLQGRYANDVANIAQAVNNLELAKINLFQILNIPYRKDLQYEPIGIDSQISDYQASSDSIYRTALKILPGVQSADLKVKAFQKGIAAARGQYYPTLSLNAGINTSYSNQATTNLPGNYFNDTTSSYITYNGGNYNVIEQKQNSITQNISFGDQFKNNRYTQVYLQLNVPILNYMTARNNVKLAKINLKNAENNAVSTKLVLQQNVEQAYQNMQLANSQYKAFQDEVKAYAESFRTTEIRFNEGVITADVYLIAKNNIDQANISLTIAKFNYILRTKVLDYYQGNLKW
jgi:outer membrane protein